MRNEYFGDYVTVAIFLLAGALIVGGGIFAARLVAPSRPNVLKSTAYESGIEPIGGGWNQSHIRYYIFGIFFLIFDVEAVFLFPWAVIFLDNTVAFYAMLMFLGVLAFAILYAWRKGALELSR